MGSTCAKDACDSALSAACWVVEDQWTHRPEDGMVVVVVEVAPVVRLYRILYPILYRFCVAPENTVPYEWVRMDHGRLASIARDIQASGLEYLLASLSDLY